MKLRTRIKHLNRFANTHARGSLLASRLRKHITALRSRRRSARAERAAA